MAGRPSKYSPQLADIICERMINGEDLTKICEDKGMPSRVTVWRWMKQHPEFATQYAHAREALAEFEIDHLRELASKCTEENYKSTAVKLNHFQWRLMKISPKRFGDKLKAEVSGVDGEAIKVEETIKLDPRELSPEARKALEGVLTKVVKK